MSVGLSPADPEDAAPKEGSNRATSAPCRKGELVLGWSPKEGSNRATSAPCREWCESDYVDVYAQLQEEREDLLDAALFGRFCGESMDNLPKQKIISTGNVLVVSFFTDSTKTNRGFQASFEFFDDSEYDIGTKAPPILCGFTVRSEFKQRGYLVSPTYPGTYPDNQLCYYKLEGKVGERIRLRFQEFVLFHGGE
ncbi:hypothetical protein ACOMHN_062079 [Nucella lapillus]